MPDTISRTIMSKRRMSVAQAMILTLVVVNTLALTAFGVVYYVIERQHGYDALRSSLKVTLEQLATSLAMPVWNFEDEQAGKIIESTMTNPEVFAVSVRSVSPDRRIASRVRDADWAVTVTEQPIVCDEQDFSASTKILASGAVIGIVELHLSTRFLSAQLRKTLVNLVGSILSLNAMLVFLLFLILNRAIMRPIAQVERFALQMGAGSEGAAISGKPFLRELEVLRNAIEAMVLQLKNRYDELAESKTALAEAELRYRAIFENALTGIFQCTSQGRFVSANPAMARILGYDLPDELLEAVTDITSQLFVDPGDPDLVFRRLQQEKSFSALEMRFVRKDGTRRWGALDARGVFDADGNLIMVEGMLEDITDRIAAQRALLSSESRYRQLFNSANDAIFVHSIDNGGEGRILDVNDVACHRLGYRREELLGQSARDIVAESWRGMLAAIEFRLLEQGHIVYEIEQVAKDGDRIPVEISVHLFELEGRPAALSIARDITERKRAQEELAAFNRHLGQLVADRTEDLARKASELEAANQQLRELDNLKSAFLSSVSHELRTPLTSILGFAKLIAKDFTKAFLPLGRGAQSLQEKGERVLRNLGIIKREGERLTRLINDFLDLTKIESGRLEWHDCNIQAAEILHRAIASVSSLVAAKPLVRLETAIPDDLPFLHVDPDRLEQVIINILSNAFKFTESGAITIGAAITAQKRLRVGIADTGIGIPDSELTRIFDKFHQVIHQDTLVDKKVGTGLGLAICRQIITHYGGSIWAESTMGQGSSILFELPVSDTSPTAPVLPAEAEAEAEEEARESSQPVVLVVDDDAAVRDYLSQVLKDDGYVVLTAADGASAIATARRCRPDCITMDIIMPGLGGRDTIRLLRKDTELNSIPILVISVLQDEEFNGEDAVLRKPIDPNHVLDAVRALLTGVCVKRPMAMLHREGVELPRQFVTLCTGSIAQFTENEFWQRMEDGFEGTVILPAWAAQEEFLDRLENIGRGINVLILPAQPEA